MIFQSVVGSRALCLEDDGSDFDCCAVTIEGHEPKILLPVDNYHIFSKSPSQFGGFLKYNSNKHHGCCQWIFPYQFCLDNDLTRWIKENREEMILATLPEVYEVYTQSARELELGRRLLYPEKMLKLAAYSLHFRDMLINYANGMTFDEARQAKGERQQFLLSLRRGDMPLKVYFDENDRLREEVKKVADFYKDPKANPSILQEFRYMIKREVELLINAEDSQKHTVS